MKRLIVLCVLALTAAPLHAADKVTLVKLLQQMTDLSLLAEYPDPPYTTKQFSSYDRASEKPGHESWFANADRGFVLYSGVVTEKTPFFKTGPNQMSGPDGHFDAGTKVAVAPTHKQVGGYAWAYATSPDGTPIDGKTPQGYIKKISITFDPQGHVLAEMDGPGCVVRIWSPNPDDGGKIRIYLDNAKEPVIDAGLTELLSGKWKTKIGDKEVTPFPDPFACEHSRGFNLYFPIAYAKHCKIVVEKSDIYYHVDYRTYPKGTEVETFTFKEWAGQQDLLKEVTTSLANRTAKLPEDVIGHSLGGPEKLAAGGKFNLPNPGRMDGAGAICVLSVRIKAEKLPEALRSVVLVGTFDNAETPQIWCPLGDFFGTSPGANAYASLPLAVSADGTLTSVWSMPFQKRARFQLHNLGTQEVEILDAMVGMTKYKWTDRSMHFHAKWRSGDLKTRPFQDWTFCDLKGKGVFVGDMLSVMNPVPAWWGEGDEKIFVDGEKFPSWFGTGTEDYFGYGWSDPTPFHHAYHNQTRCDGEGSGATFGLSSVNRFHILDAIPFEKSFRFDMEVWHWDPKVTVNYAATSYWYARPGATDDFKPTDAEVLRKIPAPPPPSFKIDGALEGEKLKVLKKSSKFDLGPQQLSEFHEGKWSGDAHLWGRPPKAGEWVDLELPVKEDGIYQVIVYLTKAPDYGIVQLSLDGKALGKPIDGFNADKVISTGPIELGKVELKKGTATLRIEVTGSNEKAVGLKTMFGFDCMVLKKQGDRP